MYSLYLTLNDAVVYGVKGLLEVKILNYIAISLQIELTQRQIMELKVSDSDVPPPAPPPVSNSSYHGV